MTQITLQAYLTDIQKLLDDNRLTEAVAHCKYILQQYPRYIEAYRLLGKALLEQHEYVSAADVFQRILSTDPEDFVAYVGLAVVYKAEDLMNEAIWHMERAYEIQPYNITIQRELRDLYAWRDGELKTRELHLTNNALARMHFNAELYPQAVSELRTFLKDKPDRVDAQVLLAEALWRDNQRVDAVEVCLKLLEILPYCIKANAILSEIWLMTGRIDEAQEYLQKLQAIVLPTTATLNEDSPVSHAFGTDGAISVPPHININKLDKVVEEEVVLTGVPDWVDELELSDNAFLEDTFGSDDSFGRLSSGSDDRSPDWLQALTTPSPVEHGGRDSADVLDWLREVASGDTDHSLQVADDLPDTADMLDEEASLPNWLSEVLDDSALIPPVDPSFATDTEPEMETGAAAETNIDDEAWLFDDTTDAPPGVPDWMSDTPTDLELHAPTPRESLSVDAVPDWLDDHINDPDVPLTASDWFTTPSANDITPPDDEQLSDWLDSLAGDTTETPPASSPARHDDLPDWFSDMTTMPDINDQEETDQNQPISPALPDWLQGNQSEKKPTSSISPKTATEPDLPDWLSDLTTVPPSSEAPTTTGVDIPDWLEDVASGTETESTGIEQTQEAQPDAAAFPDWLTDLGESPTASATIDHQEQEPSFTLPDWLNTPSETETPPSEHPDTADIITTDEPETSLPDWLSGLSVEPDTNTSDAPVADWSHWFNEETNHDQAAAAADETDSDDWTNHFPSSNETDSTDWLTHLATIDEDVDETSAEAAPDQPNWFGTEPDTDVTEGADLPDWLTHFSAEEENLAADESGAKVSDWFVETPAKTAAEEPAETPDEDDWLAHFSAFAEENNVESDTTADADWLKAMPELPDEDHTEQSAAASSWSDDLFTTEDHTSSETAPDTPEDAADTSLPDWLKELNALDDSDDTAQKKTEFTDPEVNETPSSLTESLGETLAASATERETMTMPDSPQKNPHDDKAKTSSGELDWLDELASLPLDEPTTIPNSEGVLQAASEDEGTLPSNEDEGLDEADMAWLDALGPTDATADQTLDWLEQMEQPEVEEAPTLSWLSDDDLQGQATGSFSSSDHDNEEDLGEAMSWLESLVTDPTVSDEPPPAEQTLNWLDELGDLQAGEEVFNEDISAVAEEMPTTAESIPAVTDDVDWGDDLFSLADEESGEDVAAAMSWLDELAQAGSASPSSSTDLPSAGMPPEDPEAAMAWLEQLAAAQAAELDDEMGVAVDATWGAPDDELSTSDSDNIALDWMDDLVEPAGDEAVDTVLIQPSDLEQPDAAALDWLEEVVDVSDEQIDASEPSGGALPNWLDELAATSPDDLLDTGIDVPDSDWLDTFAAAAPDELAPLEESAGEPLPNWLDELAAAPIDAPLHDEAETETEPEAEVTPPSTEAAASSYEETTAPTYVPPTHISAEAAKILDMSDLFDLGNVEESEEDMAQAMAWMNELIGDMGTPPTAVTPPESDLLDQSSPEPTLEIQPELSASEVEVEPVVSEEKEPEPVAETGPVAEPTYVPPTTISAEAAKILDMSDLFDLGNVEESEEDMAQAMAWMEELMGDTGIATPEATILEEEITPEPVPVVLEQAAEPEITTVAATDHADEAMSWLDEIVAEIGEEPVAAAVPVSVPDEDEAMSWLDEIVADLSEEAAPTQEQTSETPAIVTEAPTASALIVEPEPHAESVITQPDKTSPAAAVEYTPPTDISPEAAKILDMSDLFDLGTVEESEEDMAQAMAWMAELIGDMGTTTAPEGSHPAAAEPESELPETIISATPVIEEDSAVDWLDDLASQETPFAPLPDLDKTFAVDDLDTEPVTEEDTAAALNWLNQMSLEQETHAEQPPVITTEANRDDALLDELTNIPEDPDAAMDWLEQMAAQQSGGTEPVVAPKTPIVEEPRTPAVPPEVMDALAEVETKREKAKTGPLKPPPDLFPEQKETEIETPLSLISELTSGDVAESLPDWLSLDVIGEDDSTLSWLSDKDLDATGWLEAEAEMVDVEPAPISLPLVTPAEPVRSEPIVRREPTPSLPPVEPLNFQVNLDVGTDEGAFAAARQLLQTRQYNEAIRNYANLLETSPGISPLITELEGAVDTHPSQPLLRRLLGDAYMRNGQLQKALETYRKALDQL